MDFEKTELTPMIDTKRPQTKGLRSANDPEYFTNIDGKYVKDAEARAELADVEEYVYGALEPWEPLEDGYSNFWFELTDDTLSPWLNFSAKNNNATIDWGDGSGEVALDTLTPTHTYSKAGKYVVKVKGVTGLAKQITSNVGKYYYTLTAAELNNEMLLVNYLAFGFCKGMKYLYCHSADTELRSNSCQYSGIVEVFFPNGLAALFGSSFSGCANLTKVTVPSSITEIGGSTFAYCYSLLEVTLPTTLTSIGGSAFYNCSILYTIHCRPTVPPTLGNNAFAYLPADFVIYVPVGYGDTYKAASGWSTYADHIVEEGSTLTRSQLRNIELENSKKTDDTEEMR